MKLRLFDPLYHCNVSESFKVNQYEQGETFAKIIYPFTHNQVKDKQYPNKYPILFFVQGDGTSKDSLNQEIAQLSTIARYGYCVVILSYRDLSYGKLPLQVHDVMDSIYSLLSMRYGNYPFDTSSYFISGNGLGGYLAVQAALHLFAKYPTLNPSCLKGVIDFYGPSDFEMLVQSMEEKMVDFNKNDYLKYLGVENYEAEDPIWEETSVLNALNETTIRFPLFIIHGTDDLTVPVEQSQILERIALANCFDVVYLEIENANHGGELIFGDNMLYKVQEYMHNLLFPKEDPYRY